MTRSDWPALAGFQKPPEGVLYAEHAVWGKVHGQASGYRWIAKSPKFEGALDSVESQLCVGLENRPTEMPSWRFVRGKYYAVWSYPSRAEDAGTRKKFLEKQVLEWKPAPNVPATAAALILLSRPARVSDNVWFDHSANAAWSDRDYSLELPPVVEQISAERLEVAIGLGLRNWLNRCPDSLAAFYALLRTSHKPAVLGGMDRPLSPTGLAALLLPLPTKVSEGLSLAGWTPSDAPDDRDGERWDGMVQQDPIARAVEPSLEDRCKAQSLCSGDATLAVRPLTSVTQLLDFARSRQRWIEVSEIRRDSMDLSQPEKDELRGAVQKIRNDAKVNIGLPAVLATARSRQLDFKADVLEAACFELYQLSTSGPRVKEVLDHWQSGRNSPQAIVRR